jgi:hypothetical protein
VADAGLNGELAEVVLTEDELPPALLDRALRRSRAIAPLARALREDRERGAPLPREPGSVRRKRPKAPADKTPPKDLARSRGGRRHRRAAPEGEGEGDGSAFESE